MCACAVSLSDIISKAAGNSPSTTHTHAHHDTAACHNDQADDDVDNRDGPEGKKVGCLIAVQRCVGVITWLIDGINPHVTYNTQTHSHLPTHVHLRVIIRMCVFTCNKPAEQEECDEGIPGGA